MVSIRTIRELILNDEPVQGFTQLITSQELQINNLPGGTIAVQIRAKEPKNKVTKHDNGRPNFLNIGMTTRDEGISTTAESAAFTYMLPPRSVVLYESPK